MFDVLVVLSNILTGVEAIKEKFVPVIPVENWANKELYSKDVINGVPIEQRMNNLKNGKYKEEKRYEEPHRDPIDGKIIIENCALYEYDIEHFGVVQTYKWVEQGKYNLTSEELKIAEEEHRKKLERLFSY